MTDLHKTSQETNYKAYTHVSKCREFIIQTWKTLTLVDKWEQIAKHINMHLINTNHSVSQQVVQVEGQIPLLQGSLAELFPQDWNYQPLHI